MIRFGMGDDLGRRAWSQLADMIRPPQEQDPEEVGKIESARRSLEAFTLYTFPGYQLNWHHRVLFQTLERFCRGEISRLIVNMPPQHGKTEAVSRRLPAYILGRNPDARVMACSYGNKLAILNNRDVQKVIDSDRYRALFPQTQLFGQNVRSVAHGRYLRNSDIFEVVGRRGAYRSGGVGSGITGLPFNVGIIDDYFKDDKEASSQALRDALWNWYTTTFYPRKTEGRAAILICATRWHEDDLVGRLLALAAADASADQWHVLSFPAILEAEEERDPRDPRQLGEALWEARHPRKELEAARVQSGSYRWSAIYKQRPTPAGGTLIKRDFFRYFLPWRDGQGTLWLRLGEPRDGEPPPRQVKATDCTWYQCVDTALKIKTPNAYTCVGTFARTPWGDLLVYHIWRFKLEVPYQYPALNELRAGQGRYDPTACTWVVPGALNPWPAPILYQAVEEKASGTGLIQQAALDGRPFRVLKTKTDDKVQRAANTVVLYENGKVYHLSGAEWLHAFEEEMLKAPNAAYLDQFDVMAYAGIECVTSALLSRGLPEDTQLVLWPAAATGPGGKPVPPPPAAGDTLQIGDVKVFFNDLADDWHNQ